MNNRFMRMLVLFDLPMDTNAEKKHYSQFRKYLITNGFFMLQESIYTKLLLNATAANTLADNLDKHKPPQGNVIVLTITENQFARMTYLVGEASTEYVSSEERLIVL